MLLLIYIFNENQKLKSNNEQENDFLTEEITYVKVNNVKEIQEDILNRDFKKKYVEYFIIITKQNICRVHSINREFDKHYILESKKQKLEN